MQDVAGSPCPINCIVSPQIWLSVVQAGNDRQREIALRALEVDHSFRSARIGHAGEQRAAMRARRLRRRALRGWPFSLTEGHERRTIYDAHNTQRLPGRLVRSEGDPATNDPATDEAYDYLGATYDFYLGAYGRDSIDDEGMRLDATVHYGVDYDNAFWDGRRMVFGDGDGELFNRFTIAVDVVGHELTHGVTDAEGGLIYFGQSGALNESVSDVFASLIKQYANNEKAEDADWLIGEGLLADGVDGVALRSMKAPGTAYDDPVLGKDTQPADMAHYDRSFGDNGAVHNNSGIPNHAFYLIATDLGGYAWERAGLIWYETLCSPLLSRSAQFDEFARLTLLFARQLFPDSLEEQQAVRDGWAQVGISV